MLPDIRLYRFDNDKQAMRVRVLTFFFSFSSFFGLFSLRPSHLHRLDSVLAASLLHTRLLLLLLLILMPLLLLTLTLLIILLLLYYLFFFTLNNYLSLTLSLTTILSSLSSYHTIFFKTNKFPRASLLPMSTT